MIVERKHKVFLFIGILGIFSIIALGFKFIIGFLQDGTSESRTVISDAVEEKNAISSYSEQDMIVAKRVVTSFLPLYLKKKEFMVSTLTTPRFYAMLQEEINNPFYKEKIRLKGINKSECSAGSHKIQCFLTTNVMEEENVSVVKERVYEVILVRQQEKWLVDEVNVRGTFE